MNKIKSLIGDTVLYGLGSIIPRMLNFFLIILHTRIFTTEEYGVFTQLYIWVAVLNVIYLFGMETAYFRFATKAGADETRIFRAAQTFVLGISLLLSATFLVLTPSIASALAISDHPEFISWLAILMFVDAAVSIPFARLRLQRKATLFAVAKIINVLIQIGLNFYFLFVIYDPSIGIGYVILANVIANLFYIIFFLKTLLNWRPAIDRELFSSMFKYSFPIMITGLAGMVNEMFSRQMLANWLPPNFYPGESSKSALGIFGANYRLSVIMTLAVQAFRFAAEPFFFSHANHKDSPWLFAKINHYFTILCCFILLTVSVNLDILQYFLGESYRDGLVIVPILLAGIMFLGIYYNFSVWFKLTDKTYYGTIITIGGVVLTVSLNYLLIPHWGYIGSSWATLACYFSMAMVCYALGQKYFPIPYKLADELGYLFFAFILIQVSSFVKIPNQIMATGFHTMLMIFFLAITYWRERKYWSSSVD